MLKPNSTYQKVILHERLTLPDHIFGFAKVREFGRIQVVVESLGPVNRALINSEIYKHVLGTLTKICVNNTMCCEYS